MHGLPAFPPSLLSACMPGILLTFQLYWFWSSLSYTFLRGKVYPVLNLCLRFLYRLLSFLLGSMHVSFCKLSKIVCYRYCSYIHHRGRWLEGWPNRRLPWFYSKGYWAGCISALQRKSHLCIPFLGKARPQPQFHILIHVSVNDLYIPRIGLHISSSRIGRPIVEIYKSLTDAWMWKLGLRPRYSFSGNVCFEFWYFVFAVWSNLKGLHIINNYV